MKIQFVRSKELILTTHAGLATVGALLAHTKLTKRLNHSVIKEFENPIHSHSDVMKSYLGLLCQGKGDFEQADWNRILLEESTDLLHNIDAPLNGLMAGNECYLPLDIDVSPFDNSGTRKEGVSRTYKGTD